ncbi:MarR family winged helix-turn-helix transcriptional regulator [Paramicrobacterium agarici]|uniref:MarR family transcriptional regulator n=1 Tax=Paramicrobacterium agarici TaxID=630514 RepID=A0A2A9DXI6_9MICO|nr:MarR family transcriptional regulator [Microbacterium agarici]PFG30640.1 MarR family transcriptional regulator [Microbacterium agarici]TQO23658.1 MarR family transcriptional regulator [Microbacterium agarici]
MIVIVPEGKNDADPSIRYFAADPSLVDTSQLSSADVEQCIEVMEAVRQWREADRALTEASRRYMRLNDTDMRAIRFVIRRQEQGSLPTPKDIGREVGISSASTTKLVDRLVAGGHVVRVPHPNDRRTTCITVTSSTRRAARETVGRQHARRFAVAAALSAPDRATVVRFLTDLAAADVPTGALANIEQADAQALDSD